MTVTNAMEAAITKRRGPRKKKEVVKQSDVPAAFVFHLNKQSPDEQQSNTSLTEAARIFGSKISFGSTEKRMKKQAQAV